MQVLLEYDGVQRSVIHITDVLWYKVSMGECGVMDLL